MQPMTLEEVRGLCDHTTFQNARQIVASGAIHETARTEAALFARVIGTKPYIVTIRFSKDRVTAKCTCPASRSARLCKHAVAVLIVWAESPERFMLGESETAQPQRAKPPAAPRARREKVERSTLQVRSVLLTLKLALHLARKGMLSATSEHIAQLRQIAENLAAQKTRRLAQSVAWIADLLQDSDSTGGSDLEETYVELLAGLWLTARALQEHYEGRRLLPPEQREEMVGHTWRDGDLVVRENVRLMELAYESLVTPKGFRLDISHLIDLDDGTLYREMKIVPLHIRSAVSEYKPPRPRPFLAHRVGIYPGYPPRRIKIFSEEVLPGPLDWRQALQPYAMRSVLAMRRAFCAHVADPFAPPVLTAIVAPARPVWWDSRAWLADETGELLPLQIQTMPEIVQGRDLPLEHILAAIEMPLLFGYLRIMDGELGFMPISGITERGVEMLRCGVHIA